MLAQAFAAHGVRVAPCVRERKASSGARAVAETTPTAWEEKSRGFSQALLWDRVRQGEGNQSALRCLHASWLGRVPRR